MGQISSLDKLDQLEERVDDRLNQAEAMARLQQGSLEARFSDLEKQTEVDAEMAELKRKLGMA
jgi:phage shock protein A